MKKIILPFLLAFLALSCNTTKSTTTATSTEDNAEELFADSKFPGFTKEKFEEGKSLFENNCNLCHGLEESYGKSEEVLAKYVPGMSRKVNDKKGKEVISEEGKKLIFEYLVTINSKK